MFMIILIVIIVVRVLSTGYVVRQQHVAVIERLGKFHGFAGPGFHVKFPFIDVTHDVSLMTEDEHMTFDAKTSDNVTIELDVSIQYHVDYGDVEKGADSAYDLFIGGYIMGIEPDAYSLLFRTGASANYFGYSNPATDALFDQGVLTNVESERKDIYAKLQRQIADVAVFFPLADNLKLIAVNKRIGGVDQAQTAPIYTFQNWNKLTEK